MKLVINDDKVIAMHDNSQEIDSLYPNCIIITDNNFTGKIGDEYIIPLEAIKALKLAEVNAKAYDYEDNGSISYAGIDIDGNSIAVQIETSDKNIGKINGIINMFNAEKITQYIWSAKDDTQFVVKKDDAYNLSELFAEFSSKIWLEKQLYFKNLVEKATTVDEVNAIVVDYSADVPNE